jgi:hypothetical protein
MKRVLSWLGATVVSFALLGCGSDNDSDYNLKVESLTATVEHTNYGDEVEIRFDLNSQGFDAGEVDVHFFLLHADELQQDHLIETEISELHALAVDHFPLDGNTTTHSLVVTIPEDVAGGDYQIVSYVDPNNIFNEDNENDNAPHPEHSLDEYPHAPIHVIAAPDHDHQLSNVQLGISQLILDKPGLQLDDGEIHRAEIIGHMDVRYHGSVTGVVKVIGEIDIDGQWLPVHFWQVDESADNDHGGTYQDAMTVTLPLSEQANHVAFDINIDDAYIDALYQHYDAAVANEVTIRLTLEDATGVNQAEHSQDNNSVTVSVPLYFFEGEADAQLASANESHKQMPGQQLLQPQAANVNYAKDFDAVYGNQSKFAVGVDLHGQLLLVPVVVPGARIVGEGEVFAYFFNARNTLFGISFDGSAYSNGQNTGYATEMVIFNNTVFEDESYTAQYEKSWSRSWEEEKVLAQARFFVGPIPMNVEAGVTGNLGFELAVGYNAELYGGGDLFHVDFGAFGRGGISLLIASGGVQAVFNLIDNTFSLDSTAGFALASSESSSPHIYYSTELADDIDAVSGKFGLYADVKGIKWCKKLFIPYPCGSQTTRYDLWLYQTPSVINKTWTLLEREGQIAL